MTIVALLCSLWIGVDEPGPIPLAEISSPPTYTFDRDIFPILEAKCLTCHDKEGGLAEGDLDLTSLASLTQGGKHGPSIQVGKGAESLVFLRSSRNLKPFMPPEGEGDPLNSEEITKLKIWIDQGGAAGENPSPGQNRKRPIQWESLPKGVLPVLAIAFSPDGNRLAFSRGNEALVAELPSGSILARLPVQQDFVTSIAWSPDGQRLAIGSFGQVRVWTTAAANPWPDPKILEPINERANTIAFSPDGSLIAVGAGSPSQSGEITIWSTQDGSLARRFAEPHSDLVTGLAYSPDGQSLASSSADKFIKQWKSDDGSLMKSYEGHTGAVLGVGWSPDGKQIVSAGADSSLKIWNVDSGEQALSQPEHRLEVTSARFLPGRRQIVTTAGDRLARLWNADDGKLIRVLQGSTDFLLCNDVTRDAKRIAAGNQSGDITIWNADDGTLIQTISPPAQPSS
jgi:WD40 repeat protein